jgi:hypothetical protein
MWVDATLLVSTFMNMWISGFNDMYFRINFGSRRKLIYQYSSMTGFQDRGCSIFLRKWRVRRRG